MFDAVTRDIRYALRQMRASPIVTAVAVLSLALGVGANTAIFSLVNAMLLKGLPVHAPDRLVELNDTVTHPIWEQLRDRQDALVGVVAYSSGGFNLARRGPARTVRSMYISGGGFEVLGLQPALGRLLTAADDRRDGGPSGPSAVISYGFWQREYGGLPTVVGQTIWLDSHPFTIVGVTPRAFTGLVVGEQFDVAVPLNTQAIIRGAGHMLDNRRAWWVFVVGRLAPGQTRDEAQTRLRAVQPQIREATLPPDSTAADLEDYLVEPLTLQEAGGFSMLRRRYTQPLLVLMGIVGLVLLIACANLANLLLARAAARQRELAVRLSMGASRAQLIRQLLIESLVLAFVSAAAGFAAAQAGSRLLLRMISTQASIVTLDLTLDWRVLGFSIGLAVLTGLLFGIAPALRATALRPVEALRQGGRTVAGAGRRFGFGQLLVGTQVALSLILVFAAALFVRSFVGLAGQSLGFDADRVLTVELDLRQLSLDGEGQSRITAEVIERVKAVPGVSSAAAGFVTPVSSSTWIQNVEVPGYTASGSVTERSVGPRDSRSFFNAVSPGYLRTVGTPLVAGRDFSAGDRSGAPRVAIVNQAFVDKFLSGTPPIGVTFKSGTAPRQNALTIVGVTATAKYRYMREDLSPTVLVPMAQTTAGFFNNSLYVRTDLLPSTLTTAVAGAIAEVHPDIVLHFRPLSDIVGAAMLTERVVATLSGFFGVLALVLAMIGLYGVMSYAVARRRNEIGVRMALGAVPARVLAMVMRDVGIVTVAGIVVGAAVAVASGKVIASLLYGLSPDDTTTLALAAIALTAAAAFAGYLPARRAASLDPMRALREE
jgi:predicted permease